MRRVILFLIALFPLAVSAQIIKTIGGTGSNVYTGEGIPAVVAGIPDPRGAAFDKQGNFYYTDGNVHRVRKIDEEGIIRTVAGSASGGFSGDSGLATLAGLYIPVAVAFDSFGNLYVADNGDNRIRKVEASTGIISTYAGNGVNGYSGDDSLATMAKISSPSDICFDKFGNIYIGDPNHYVIRKVNTLGIISTFAGNGLSGSSAGDNGPATAASINGPSGLTADDSGNIYIAERIGNRVRKVRFTGIISTYAGNGNPTYLGDGIPATGAQIVPLKLGFDSHNQLYIADDYNERIFRVDTLGIIHLVAGNGTGGFSGDGFPATAAELKLPAGIAFDQCGNLYFPDAYNYRIREVELASTTPTISLTSVPTGAIGSSVTISALVANAGNGYVIKWLNHGTVFATTTSPSVTYIKTAATDSITAIVYGCGDSTVSTVHIVTTNHVLVPEVFGVSSEYPKVWPEPMQSVLNIELKHPAKYQLLTIVGSRIKEGELPDGEQMLDVSTLSPGVYLLALNFDDGRKVVVRVVKQ